MTNTHNNDEKQTLYNNLVEEVKVTVQKLKDLGMTEKGITTLLHSEQPLVKLIVSKNYRIYLGDCRVEVRMEPIVKAVYLLFLKHPEGILFKRLPDYREELTEIYLKLKPYGMTDRTLQSIEDVTNPTLNSINEKCSRIKAAFLEHVDDSIAEQYYIAGKSGDAKRIALSRNLVVWE